MKPDLHRYFSSDEINIIKSESPKAEKLGKWTPALHHLAEEKRLYHLLVPKRYGGQQLALPDYLPWLECASWLDGSFGWNLTLASGAGVFAAYMNSDLAEDLFSGNKIFISGSGFPGGTAQKQDEDSYLVNGKWKYASGIRNADLVTASCYIEENGQKVFKGGKAVIKAIACNPEEVDIIGNWNAFGLKATNTLDFEINNKRIPKRRVFKIDADSSKVDDPLYQFPFLSFAKCTLATSLLGMAERFTHEAITLLLARHQVNEIDNLPDKPKQIVEQASNQIMVSHNNLLVTVTDCWNSLDDRKNYSELNDHIEDTISNTVNESYQKILDGVQLIYPFLGMQGANYNSVLNRCWRDINTASQHMLLSPTSK